MPTSESPWLTAEQQQVWRTWLALGDRLPAVLQRQLARDSGLSFGDFDVLVQLSEAPLGRLRVGDLATALTWERSRVSHHVKRMQSRDLVARDECVDDARGAYIVITPTGTAALTQAAPGHARTVKDLLFADLTDAELAGFGRVLGRLLDRVSAPQDG